jgi:hypothetical protein
MNHSQLLKDVKTKWNSILTMIERILTNKQLIFNIFLIITDDTLNSTTKKGILKRKRQLTEDEWNILFDLTTLLLLF